MFWWEAPITLHVLGVDDVQVLCIDQFGKQTGPEWGYRNNRKCLGYMETIICCVSSKVQGGGFFMFWSDPKFGFLYVATFMLDTFLKLSDFPFPLRKSVFVIFVLLPDGDQQNHQEGENHLHVGQRIHSKGAEDDQLDHLQRSKVMDFPLRHAANVVGGWIGGLGRQSFLFRGFSQSVTLMALSKSNHFKL